MQGHRLRISQSAREDLVDISLYGDKQWGVVQRRRYMACLYRAFANVCAFPELGFFHVELETPCRSRIEGRHRIFYVEKEGGIEILRILRQEADICRHL